MDYWPERDFFFPDQYRDSDGKYGLELLDKDRNTHRDISDSCECHRKEKGSNHSGKERNREKIILFVGGQTNFSKFFPCYRSNQDKTDEVLKKYECRRRETVEKRSQKSIECPKSRRDDYKKWSVFHKRKLFLYFDYLGEEIES